MPFYNSVRPYTPQELVFRIQEEERINKRSAERHISLLVKRGSLKKHVVRLNIGGKSYRFVFYQYLGLYIIMMSYAAYLVFL